MPASIFADEWRDCLRAHYSYVIRADDRLTERTLRGVMIHEAGFTEAELKELEVRATMRVEEVPADFTPDLDILQEDATLHTVAVAMPQEVIHALVVEDALEHDAQADAAAQADITAEAELLDASDELVLEGDDPADELLLDDMPVTDEVELVDDDAEADEPPPHDPEGAQQLSLF